MKTPPHIFPCQRASLYYAVFLFALFALLFLILAILPAFSQEATNVPARTHLDPATVQTQFNAWSVVLFGIGAVVWHLILKAWPGIKAVYPYVVANGGIFPIIGRFLYVPKPKQPADPAQPKQA